MSSSKQQQQVSYSNSIKLIENQNNNLVLTQEGINHLIRLNGEFAVLVCLGPSSLGKSYLLNKIIRDSHGFDVRVGGQTKGVWMYRDLIEMRKPNGKFVKLLVIDTEVFIILKKIKI
jgi:hypothetical protein